MPSFDPIEKAQGLRVKSEFPLQRMSPPPEGKCAQIGHPDRYNFCNRKDLLSFYGVPDARAKANRSVGRTW